MGLDSNVLTSWMVKCYSHGEVENVVLQQKF